MSAAIRLAAATPAPGQRLLPLVSIPSFAEFQGPIRQGAWAKSAHFVLHLQARPVARLGSTAPHRIGALLPKRFAKKAVRRNLLRRLIYQEARLRLAQWPQSGGVDCVVRLRAAWLQTAYPSASSTALRTAVQEELQQLFSAGLARAQTQTLRPAP